MSIEPGRKQINSGSVRSPMFLSAYNISLLKELKTSGAGGSINIAPLRGEEAPAIFRDPQPGKRLSEHFQRSSIRNVLLTRTH